MTNKEKVITPKKLYTSRIIKASALLADTKNLLRNWDETLSVTENLNNIRKENIFGKASRSRVEDILQAFRLRYLSSEAVIHSLVVLVKSDFPTEALNCILYFFSAQSDLLLHDTVTKALVARRNKGLLEVGPVYIRSVLTNWLKEGHMVSQWSEETVERVAQGLLATLRDFGILQGAVNKTIAPTHLPKEAFAFIAFYLWQIQPSGKLLLSNSEWQLFFLDPQLVERYLIEVHQSHLLEYHAAGSVIRIAFPAQTLEGYARALTERTY